MLAYNSKNFDYPYLVNRCVKVFPKGTLYANFPKAISPIEKTTYRDSLPAGIAMMDYYEMVKKIYKYKRYNSDR
jgi:DNA polymerase elongation subunit (family B)